MTGLVMYDKCHTYGLWYAVHTNMTEYFLKALKDESGRDIPLDRVEIIPMELLPRGGVSTIERELEFIAQQQVIHNSNPDSNTVSIRMYQNAIDQGFKYILRIPRTNEALAIQKYGNVNGPFLQNFSIYNKALVGIAARMNIQTMHILDHDFAFQTEAEAQRFREELVELQADVNEGRVPFIESVPEKQLEIKP